MKKILFFLLCTCAFISGCTKNIAPNTYTAAEVGVVSKVLPGVIIAKRAVNIDGNSGVGALAGATAGGAAGSMVGNRTATNIVGAVGGAVVGGVVGNAVDKTINRQKGFEYIIKLKSGTTISVVQSEAMQFTVSQHVLVIYGATTRIIPDNT